MSPRFGRPRPTVLATLLLLFTLACGGAARASTVVLVRSPQPGAVTTEATVRLRGELVSAGFDVRVIDAPIGVDIRSSLEEAAAVPDVEAVVAILGDARRGGAQDSAELWVIDRVTGKTVVRRVSTEGGSARAAEMLSIRALELLRASFLEVALAAGRAPKSQPPRPPPSPEVARFAQDALAKEVAVEPTVSRPRSGWGLELGGCVLGSLDNVPASLAPIARIQRTFGEHVLGRLTVAALGTEAHLSTPAGTAKVSQQFGLAEVALRFRVEKTLQPVLSMGVGALHIAAVGLADRPYQGAMLRPEVKGGRWAVLADAGAGIRVPLAGRFELAAEAHAQVAEPYPVIRFFGNDVASTGRPTLLGSLSVIAWM